MNAFVTQVFVFACLDHRQDHGISLRCQATTAAVGNKAISIFKRTKFPLSYVFFSSQKRWKLIFFFIFIVSSYSALKSAVKKEKICDDDHKTETNNKKRAGKLKYTEHMFTSTITAMRFLISFFNFNVWTFSPERKRLCCCRWYANVSNNWSSQRTRSRSSV